MREKLDAKIDELLNDGIIEPVEGPTPWVSPLVILPKPSGEIRICVDMRQANTAVIRECHLIPTVDEVIHRMNGSTPFSKIDLKAGFHQIELEEESRVHGGDLIIHGDGDAEHDKRLIRVLETLTKNGLTVNLTKCLIRLPEIEYMGHTLNGKSISPTQDRVKAVAEARKPKSASEVRSFMGLVNYSARFIPNLATIAEPLRKLTRQQEPFKRDRGQTSRSRGRSASIQATARIERWVLRLQPYDLTVKHIPGKEMVTDALSRLVKQSENEDVNDGEKYVRFVAEIVTPKVLKTREIEHESEKDEKLETTRFISEEFESYLEDNGIEHRLSPSLWPQANGEIERQNRTLLKSMRIAESQGKDWKDELYKSLLAYRTTPHETTAVTPSKLMFSREIRPNCLNSAKTAFKENSLRVIATPKTNKKGKTMPINDETQK
ncbi:hypothetical protein ScPMuIL_017353 [Solemya velum]